MPDHRHNENYKGWDILVWVTPIKCGPNPNSPIECYVPGIIVTQNAGKPPREYPLVFTNQFREPAQCLDFGIQVAREYIDTAE